MSEAKWCIKTPLYVRQAMKRLSDEKQTYLNADCIYDDVRVLDKWIGIIIRDGVSCRIFMKELEND